MRGQAKSVSMIVAQKIKAYRADKKMSIDEFVGLGNNVSNMYYKRWTNGRYNFTLKSLDIVSQRMGITIQELVSL